MSYADIGKIFNVTRGSIRNRYMYYTKKRQRNTTIKNFKGFNGMPTKWTHPTKLEGKQNPIYGIWRQMMIRCYDENNIVYDNYGGRGIKVDPIWHDYDNFYEDVFPKPENKSLDRPNNNGNYGPNNWRWATRKEQMRNTRHNVRIKHNGEEVCVAELSEKIKLNKYTIYGRIKSWGKNGSVCKKRMSTTDYKKIDINAIKKMRESGMELKYIAKNLNVSKATIYNRIKKNSLQKIKRKSISIEDLEDIKNKKASVLDIAKKYNVSTNTIYRRLKKNLKAY
jgi:transposase